MVKRFGNTCPVSARHTRKRSATYKPRIYRFLSRSDGNSDSFCRRAGIRAGTGGGEQIESLPHLGRESTWSLKPLGGSVASLFCNISGVSLIGLPSVPRVRLLPADALHSYCCLLLPRGSHKSCRVNEKAGRGGGDRNCIPHF